MIEKHCQFLYFTSINLSCLSIVAHPEKCLHLCGDPPGSLLEIFSQMGIRLVVAKLLRK